MQSIHAQLAVLTQFIADTTQQGIKIHHDARPELIEAAETLYKNGLITQHDGGYLTDLGMEATRHLESVIDVLRPKS